MKPRIGATTKAEPALFPHITRNWTTRSVMADVVIALTPAIIGSVYFTGWRSLAVILFSVACCVAAEAAACLVRRQPLTVTDGSAVVTGLLLALSLPSGIPFPAVAAGAAIAMLLVKALFGGLGKNILNPALSGRMFLSILWPVLFTIASPAAADAVSSATPLMWMRLGGDPGALDLFVLLPPAMLLLLGAAYLYLRGVITLTAPLACLGSAAAILWIFGGDRPFLGDPVVHLLSGGLILGAFFMATDYTTTPATRLGRLVFGLGAGILTAVFRLWGKTPEGVGYAILAMNAVSPLIERLTEPRPCGTGGVKHEKSK